MVTVAARHAREGTEGEREFNEASPGYFIGRTRIRAYDRYLMIASNKVGNPILSDGTACVGDVADMHGSGKIHFRKAQILMGEREYGKCNLQRGGLDLGVNPGWNSISKLPLGNVRSHDGSGAYDAIHSDSLEGKHGCSHADMGIRCDLGAPASGGVG